MSHQPLQPWLGRFAYAQEGTQHSMTALQAGMLLKCIPFSHFKEGLLRPSHHDRAFASFLAPVRLFFGRLEASTPSETTVTALGRNLAQS